MGAGVHVGAPGCECPRHAFRRVGTCAHAEASGHEHQGHDVRDTNAGGTAWARGAHPTVGAGVHVGAPGCECPRHAFRRVGTCAHAEASGHEHQGHDVRDTNAGGTAWARGAHPTVGAGVHVGAPGCECPRHVFRRVGTCAHAEVSGHEHQGHDVRDTNAGGTAWARGSHPTGRLDVRWQRMWHAPDHARQPYSRASDFSYTHDGYFPLRRPPPPTDLTSSPL
ncbi:hypothetical protein CPter291_4107 [Collimonas pratensis]|uniref:Uncharacterized protein n=1 Tax=Collimonas pratensis TaxID=279113 RepID=A0ABM5ZAX1_9BURK|nr:hypothetical protein CPter291_4107 [Collimonas pratensis]